MLVNDFDFSLPEELIAQEPPIVRGGSRMLKFERVGGTYSDSEFSRLPEFLNAGDVLVLNDSKVIPARLYAHRADRVPQAGHDAGRIEVLLTEQLGAWEWKALVRPGRKVHVGERLKFLFSDENTTEGTLQAEVTGSGEFGERKLRFTPVENFYTALDDHGHMPLPPYIHRAEATADRERYQTVYAQQSGSAAAPTAGLHFTPAVLETLRQHGIEVVFVTLHVGLGTFQSVRVDRVEDIHLHTERYSLPSVTADVLNRALHEGRRVIAGGTTTVRTLEHCARVSPMVDGIPLLEAHSGATNIFLSPGSKFLIVQGLLTNFHLPKSTLLMLVCAFGGYEPVMAAYRSAVRRGYHFFSYGDCMFLA